MAAASGYALDEAVAEKYEVAAPAATLWHDAWNRLRRNRAAIFGAAIVIFMLVVGIISFFWTPYPTWLQGIGPTYQGPTARHPFGLDQAGRDILSRLMQGAAISMEVGLGAAALSSAIGIVVGLLAGFYRGWVDTVVSTLINVWYGVPDILIVMILVLTFDRHDIVFIIIAIALTGWLTMARLARGQTMSLREREFVEAARAVGTRDIDILIRHVLPNAAGPIIVQATYLIPQAMLFEAFLSFLGLGVPPPTPSWGLMTSEGYQAVQIAHHILLAPALALSITILSLVMLGDGLRDALDPRMRR